MNCICPIDIICGVLSCIGIYCCCYWGVAMRYETPALQQTHYHYYISKSKSKSKTKTKSKSKIKFGPNLTPEEFEQKQYNSDNVITEENQLELSHFYGDEPEVITKLPDEYKGENDEGIFASARFLRMFSKSVLQTSPHNTEGEQGWGSMPPRWLKKEKISTPVDGQIQVLAANTHLNGSNEVHNERNVKNMIKLPPIMSQQAMLAEYTDRSNTGKIPELLELDDMVPVHYRIQKKSPKNIVGNGQIANLSHSGQRPPNTMNFEDEQNHVQHFVHKKKSIFFSNTSSPHNSEAIIGVMLGTKKTSQNEIILKSNKTPRTPPQTPRLEAQNSLHDIRTNNAGNFMLSL
jgi:hypothetical protein